MRITSGDRFLRWRVPFHVSEKNRPRGNSFARVNRTETAAVHTGGGHAAVAGAGPAATILAASMGCGGGGFDVLDCGRCDLPSWFGGIGHCMRHHAERRRKAENQQGK